MITFTALQNLKRSGERCFPAAAQLDASTHQLSGGGTCRVSNQRAKGLTGIGRPSRWLLGALAALALAAPAAAQVALGNASTFSVLGGSAVTSIGPSTVNGDLGVSPGTSVTGFPPGTVVNGTIHAGDATAAQAQIGVTSAYNALAARTCDTNLTGQNLGGLVLTPGTYCFNTSANLTGQLTLDAQGNPNAQFVFKTGSSLVTANGSSVLLTNGATACNVAWQVGTSATLGTTSSFVGNILALNSVTANNGASISGRALARNGAVSLDSANIGGCVVPPPVVVGGSGIFSVPTLTEWGVLLLSLLIGAAVWARRRHVL